MSVSLPVPELRLLASSWALALRADRKSPQTLKDLPGWAALLPRLCDAQGVEALSRPSLRARVGAEPVRTRVAVKVFGRIGCLQHSRAAQDRIPERRTRFSNRSRPHHTRLYIRL